MKKMYLLILIVFLASNLFAQDYQEVTIKDINYQLYTYYYVPRYRFKELGFRYKPPVRALERVREEGAPVSLKIANRYATT